MKIKNAATAGIIRSILGLSSADLADYLEVNHTDWALMELGDNPLSDEQTVAISELVARRNRMYARLRKLQPDTAEFQAVLTDAHKTQGVQWRLMESALGQLMLDQLEV